MTKAEFEAAFRKLILSYDTGADNVDCVACDDSERCKECTFCRRSSHLVRCHYCVDSDRCIDCTHCHNCRDLLGCNHCKSSERCSRSAYLEQCLDCSDCHYCFGCVGLSGREFFILNEPYERSAYFKLTGELSRKLGKERLAS